MSRAKPPNDAPQAPMTLAKRATDAPQAPMTLAKRANDAPQAPMTNDGREAAQRSEQMTRATRANNLSSFFAPCWTWRSVLLSAVAAGGFYLLLPYLETLTAPPGKTTAVRSVTTAKLPPPAPPPPRVKKQGAEVKPRTPKPEMQQLRRRLVPMQAAMNLRMAIGDVGGDFRVDFGISTDTLANQVRQMVFELGELDKPPRPLARPDPVYPTQARMRKIEGVVVVEFIITTDGTVREIVVVSSQPGDMFTSAAVRAIERWRFTPGTKHGEAVATRVRQKVEFKLK